MNMEKLFSWISVIRSIGNKFTFAQRSSGYTWEIECLFWNDYVILESLRGHEIPGEISNYLYLGPVFFFLEFSLEVVWTRKVICFTLFVFETKRPNLGQELRTLVSLFFNFTWDEAESHFYFYSCLKSFHVLHEPSFCRSKSSIVDISNNDVDSRFYSDCFFHFSQLRILKWAWWHTNSGHKWGFGRETLR